MEKSNYLKKNFLYKIIYKFSRKYLWPLGTVAYYLPLWIQSLKKINHKFAMEMISIIFGLYFQYILFTQISSKLLYLILLISFFIISYGF